MASSYVDTIRQLALENGLLRDALNRADQLHLKATGNSLRGVMSLDEKQIEPNIFSRELIGHVIDLYRHRAAFALYSLSRPIPRSFSVKGLDHWNHLPHYLITVGLDCRA
jgi:hypothetical protein